MVERVRQKPNRATMSQLERWSLFSGILIWVGVVTFSVGLLVTLRNRSQQILAYANLPTNTPTASTTETATPPSTPTQPPQHYPAGWSTATPTPIGRSPTQIAGDNKGQASPTDRRDNQEGQADDTVKTGPQLALTPRPAPPPSKPPDRLVIPKIELDAPIVPIGWLSVEQEGTNTRVWQVADDVVGWHNTSSYPGQAGNIVLNGHHNIKGEVFRYLVDLEPGDYVHLYAEDKQYTFAVTEKHILKEKGEPLDVRRANARWIEPTDDEQLTMITCWPYTNNTHRLVIVAKPVPTRSIEGLHE